MSEYLLNSQKVVEQCQSLVITVLGLDPEDKLLVFRAVPLIGASGCYELTDADFVEFSPNGCQISIDTTHNPLVIDLPGTYRLAFEGATNPNVRVSYEYMMRNCYQALL